MKIDEIIAELEKKFTSRNLTVVKGEMFSPNPSPKDVKDFLREALISFGKSEREKGAEEALEKYWDKSAEQHLIDAKNKRYKK